MTKIMLLVAMILSLTTFSLADVKTYMADLNNDGIKETITIQEYIEMISNEEENSNNLVHEEIRNR